MANNRFEGKIVLVTGSDSGIGQQVLLGFAKEGASVVIHGIDDGSLEETAGLLEKEGVNESRYFKIKGLFENDKFIEELMEKTIQRFGRLDILVNNAGLFKKPGLDSFKDSYEIENMDYLWKVNTRASFALIELALPHLQKTKGCIINTCSIAGVDMVGKQIHVVAYATSKSALLTLTRFQSVRCAPLGVRVNGVLPGIHDSPFMRKNFNDLKTEEDTRRYQAHVKNLVTRIPAGVLGQVPNLVQSYLNLAASSYMNGAIWVQDGGRLYWASETEYLF